MENPEKIYLASFDENPEVLDRTWYWAKQCGCYNTEYTRTDAFIEKAVKYIANRFLAPGMNNEINDFVNYMKGE